MTVTERKREEEAPLLKIVGFTKPTEDWMRNSVFRDKPAQERDQYIRNIRNALSRENPSLLYEGVSVRDERTRTKLGMLYNMLDEGKAKILYSLPQRKKDEFLERLEEREKSAKPVKIAPGLDAETDSWIRNKVFAKDRNAGLYLQNLKTALEKKDEDLLFKKVSDEKARAVLQTLHDILSSNPRYYATDEGREEFMRSLPFITHPEEVTKSKARETKGAAPGMVNVSFVDEGERREEKTYVRIRAGGKDYLVEFENPAKLPAELTEESNPTELETRHRSLTAIALNYGGRNALVLSLSADGTIGAVFDLSDTRTAQNLSKIACESATVVKIEEPPTREQMDRSTVRLQAGDNTLIVDTPPLNKSELDFYRTELAGRNPMRAVEMLLRRSDTSIHVLKDGELTSMPVKDALELLRRERELAITHRIGEGAFV